MKSLPMPRYKITVEYDGGLFCGFQRQDGPPSVQQVLEEAIESFSGEVTRLYVAGRTDTGVHAVGQVCHFDLARTDVDPATVVRAVNFHTKERGVAVLAAELVDDTFHARFSARARHYLYRIVNRTAPAVLDHQRVWHVIRCLDVPAMQAAAHYLEGHHDFTTFRATQCQAQSSFRMMTSLTVTRQDEEVHIRASAPSFLHHQVRNMVGSLVWVGVGRWTPEDLKAALLAKSRAAGGPTAPARGLYLTHVDYDDLPTG